MKDLSSTESNFEEVIELPQHVQFEVVEDEILAINRPTVQLYEQN